MENLKVTLAVHTISTRAHVAVHEDNGVHILEVAGRPSVSEIRAALLDAGVQDVNREGELEPVLTEIRQLGILLSLKTEFQGRAAFRYPYAHPDAHGYAAWFESADSAELLGWEEANTGRLLPFVQPDVNAGREQLKAAGEIDS